MITLSAVYAAEVMGFTTVDTLMLVFLVNITAAVGAFGFGYLQDRIGHKRALGITLIVWVLMIVLAAMAVNRPVFWTRPARPNFSAFGIWRFGSQPSWGRSPMAL